MIRRIVARYADHPAVTGYQVDNEPGNEIFYNHSVFQRFVDHLRRQYGSVEDINQQWGLTYWSHRLATWADLWTPDANLQPQYALAWRRFQASLTTEFIGWQADIVREYARDDQFVTTCISYERRTVQDDAVTGRLDVTAGNPYYRMQDHLALPAGEATNQGWTTQGTWALYFTADRMFSSRQQPFLIAETNAQAIGHTWQNEPPYDGQWRQAAWALVSRGATMIEYWHWHTLHFGAETYWGGVLPHSQEPGRTYRQLAALGDEFRRAGASAAGLKPDADICIVYSNDTKWSLEEIPTLASPSGVPDPRSYQVIIDAFYRGAFEAGLQVRFIHTSQLFGPNGDPAAFAEDHPVLVAAGLLIAGDADLKWLERYAFAGGHLVVGIRTAYEDNEARARLERKPAFLADAAGVWYDEFSTLDVPITVVAAPGFDQALPADAGATRWIDGLNPDDAETLISYEHPHFGRWPAMTTRVHGSGRVTYVGTVPNPPLAVAINNWLAKDADSAWRRQTDTQTVTGATAVDGTRLHIIHNWSFTPSRFTLPAAVTDLLSDETFARGERLLLGAWDVRVLAE